MGKAARTANRAARSAATADALELPDRADMIELAMQAHDRLHGEDPAGAHDFLHALLGVGARPTSGPPLAPGLAFDHEFAELCCRHNVRAAYIAAEPVVGQTRRGRLSAGGDSAVCAVVRKALEQ